MATTSAPASPQARLTIRLAFERLERSIAPDHARHFKSTTLQDVRDAAVTVEDKLAASKSLRNMRRIEPFLMSLGRYAKVIEVLCNGTDYLPWIWAPIKLMLQLSSDYLSSLERLVDAYTQICDTLPRFERLSATFRDDVEFQKVLAMFYADILEFHGRSYKFFTQRAWRRFFDTSWSRFGNRFKAILDSLARHSELVDKEATAAAISEAKEWREKQREDVDRLEKEILATHVSSVLSWLELGGYLNQEDELERLLDHYSPCSCDWLHSHPKVARWMADDNSQQLLWLHGKPGAGKSVVCSYLVQELEKRCEVLYFFCSYRSTSNCSHVLRYLTAQILKIKPDMAAFIYDQYLCNALTPSVRHLRQLLPQLLSSMQSPRIIVDGIDEYASEEQKKIIKEILTVVKDCSVNPCCKTLLSSRDEPGISRSLSPKDAVSLTEESQHVNRAIEVFVDRKIEDIKNSMGGVLQLEQNVASSMKKKIVQRANGMFLWVHLVLVSLERIYSLKELEQSVDTLPKGLGEMYARTLDGMRERLASRDFDLAVRILEWVMFSQRPLKKAELLDGIALHHENTSLDTSTKLLEHVLETCKPLVEPGSNGTVVLVHFSLQEYLSLSESSLTVSPQKAHIDISLSCAAIMHQALDILDTKIPDKVSIIHTGQGLLNLLPYAHKYWYEHVLCLEELLGTNGTPVLELLDLLSKFSTKHEMLRLCNNNIKNIALPLDNILSKEARLRCLSSGTSLYTLLCQTISFQLFLDDVENLNVSELQEFQVDRDPTLMSRLLFRFEHIAQKLLSAESFPGLSKHDLATFKRDHGSTIFKCRFKYCSSSSPGFPTTEERAKHEETAHLQRYPCTHTECAYGTISFASPAALKKHIREFHSPPTHPKIPDTFRRKLPREIEQSVQNGHPMGRIGQLPFPPENMDRNTPELSRAGLPGSPMPDGAMPQNRSSPLPNDFDPNQMPPGMPPQFYQGQMGANGMMRPPSSHPGYQGQMTPQQLEMIARNNGRMPNGWMWPQGGPPQMMLGQQQQGPQQGQGMQQGQQQPPMGTPQQRNQQMPPPPAPTANENGRTRPSSPAQPQNQPPTPSQANKANPKKKGKADDKKVSGTH